MSRLPLALAASILMMATTPASAHDPVHHAGAETAVAPEAAPAVAVVEAFHTALKAGDTVTALALMAPDVMIFEQGGAERSRDEYASHHLADDAAYAADTDDSLARRSGSVDGDVAWVISEGRTTGQFNGRAVDRLTTETMVLRRQADGWRIQHIHWSSRAPG
jgi:ketosteroid isomerase-like protein